MEHTCAYCGEKVIDNYCPFCEMELSQRYILENGERLDNTIKYIPDEMDMYKSTSELLELETIHLLYLLTFARKRRTEAYKFRMLAHHAEEKAKGKQNEEIQSFHTTSYDEYEKATRKMWVIENIIKDRVGYMPEKINENFLARYLDKIERSQQKSMVIKKSIMPKEVR